MALHEVQTAACRVVHVINPTRNDVTVLQNAYHLHPLDLESVFSSNLRSNTEAYRDTVHLVLALPLRLSGQSHVSVLDVHVFLQTNAVIIVHDTDTETIRHLVNELRVSQANGDDTATAVAADLIFRLAKYAVGTLQPGDLSDDVRFVLQTSADEVQTFVSTLLEHQLLATADHATVFRFASHYLRHAAEQSAGVEKVLRPAPLTRPWSMPQLVAGYAAASIVVLIGAVWAIK